MPVVIWMQMPKILPHNRLRRNNKIKPCQDNRRLQMTRPDEGGGEDQNEAEDNDTNDKEDSP